MKKFFNEFSKAVVVAFVTVCVLVIAADVVQTFMAIALDRAEPGHALALMAFGTGLMTILGYCYKSFKQKDSLNRNGLKIDEKNDVTSIEKPEEKKLGFK